MSDWKKIRWMRHSPREHSYCKQHTSRRFNWIFIHLSAFESLEKPEDKKRSFYWYTTRVSFEGFDFFIKHYLPLLFGHFPLFKNVFPFKNNNKLVRKVFLCWRFVAFPPFSWLSSILLGRVPHRCRNSIRLRLDFFLSDHEQLSCP